MESQESYSSYIRNKTQFKLKDNEGQQSKEQGGFHSLKKNAYKNQNRRWASLVNPEHKISFDR